MENDDIVSYLRKAGAGEIEVTCSRHATPERLALRNFTVEQVFEALRDGAVASVEEASIPGDLKVCVLLPIGDRLGAFSFILTPPEKIVLLTASWTFSEHAGIAKLD